MEHTAKKPATKKVTLNLPAHLVENAAAFLGKKNFTEAVRDALREEMHRKACQELLAMRGNVQMQVDWKALRAMDD